MTKKKKTQYPITTIVLVLLIIVAVAGFVMYNMKKAPAAPGESKQVKHVSDSIMDVFVMSQCPYGVQAENELAKVKKRLGEIEQCVFGTYADNDLIGRMRDATPIASGIISHGLTEFFDPGDLGVSKCTIVDGGLRCGLNVQRRFEIRFTDYKGDQIDPLRAKLICPTKQGSSGRRLNRPKTLG